MVYFAAHGGVSAIVTCSHHTPHVCCSHFTEQTGSFLLFFFFSSPLSLTYMIMFCNQGQQQTTRLRDRHPELEIKHLNKSPPETNHRFFWQIAKAAKDETYGKLNIDPILKVVVCCNKRAHLYSLMFENMCLLKPECMHVFFFYSTCMIDRTCVCTPKNACKHAASSLCTN